MSERITINGNDLMTPPELDERPVTSISRRDYFAAMAMASMILEDATPGQVAVYCVECADALIAELDKS